MGIKGRHSAVFWVCFITDNDINSEVGSFAYILRLCLVKASFTQGGKVNGMESGPFRLVELRLKTESTMRWKGLDAVWKRCSLTPILPHRAFHTAPFFHCDLGMYID